MESLRIFRIHVFYIISFLLLTLIITLTAKWGAIPDLAAYIGFALSFSSLILSIFAIFQGLLSSSSLTTSISLIQEASQRVVMNAEKIDVATRALSEQVKDVPSLMTGVKEELKSHTEAMRLAEAGGNPVHATQAKLSESAIQSFLERSSVLGLLALYIAYKSHQSKKKFVLEDILKPIPYAAPLYCNAYFVASSGIDIIDYEKVDETWSVTNIHAVLKSKIVDLVKQRVEDFSKESTNSASAKAISVIDEYFENKK